MGARRRNRDRGSSVTRDQSTNPGESSTALPAAAAHRPKGPRSWIITIIVVLIVGGLLVVLARQRGWIGPPRPVLPSLKLEGVDPVLAAAIEEAEAGVRETPRSGAAWGRLGQVLFVHGMGGPAAECFARASELA